MFTVLKSDVFRISSLALDSRLRSTSSDNVSPCLKGSSRRITLSRVSLFPLIWISEIVKNCPCSWARAKASIHRIKQKKRSVRLPMHGLNIEQFHEQFVPVPQFLPFRTVRLVVHHVVFIALKCGKN